MAAISAVTLVLGVAREFFIARELRASGDADLFFRGLVIVAAVRAFSGVLFRARWVPVPSGIGAWRLARSEVRTVLGLVAIGVVSLWLMFSASDRSQLAAWVFVPAVLFGVVGGVVRALAEREGQDKAAFGSEWALPICTMAGAVALGRGALGPTLGFTAGLLIAALLPLSRLRQPDVGRPLPRRDAMTALLADTLLYVNLGLLDAGLSTWVFEPGDYARLNYAYLFVNAVLAVPTAAATVVSLRIASDRESRGRLGAWALAAGVLAAACVAGVSAVMRWPTIGHAIEVAAGWDLASIAAPTLLAATPFAGLRLANAIGRQRIVVRSPAALVPWDVAGFIARAVLLIALAPVLGIIASPLALGLAELIQLGAWLPLGRRRNQGAQTRSV